MMEAGADPVPIRTMTVTYQRLSGYRIRWAKTVSQPETGNSKARSGKYDNASGGTRSSEPNADGSQSATTITGTLKLN